jgi:hypothetical protein
MLLIIFLVMFSFYQCCRSEFFHPGSEFFPYRIPDPNLFYPGSRIRIKEFKYFNRKKWFPGSRKYDPGSSSRILTFTHHESRGQKASDPGSGSATLVFMRHHCRCCSFEDPKQLCYIHIFLFLYEDYTASHHDRQKYIFFRSR